MNAENPERPEGDPLSIWTVYDHPTDYPNNFVAREQIIHKDGSTTWGGFVVCPHLEWIRWWLRNRGLTCIPCMPGDDPVIVECWL